MKSFIDLIKIEEDKPYPKLMNSVGKPDLVVLFDKPFCGVCVNAGSTGNKVGKYSNNWLSDKKAWEDYQGKVTLSNDD